MAHPQSKTSVPCDVAKDDKFGPGVQCSQFDFTLTFEQAILVIGISSLYLILFILRLGQIYRKPIKTLPHPIYITKLVVAVAISSIHLASLVLWIKQPLTKLSVTSAVIGFVATLAVLIQIGIEHSRNVRPSTIVLLYLFASTLAEAAQIRTLYLRGYVVEIARLACASLACRVLLLVFENLPKKSYLKPVEGDFSPEELAGVFSRSVFFWLNRMLLRGNRKILTLDDLYPLNHILYSQKLKVRILRSWTKHGSSSPYSFILTHFSCFKWEALRTILPRLSITGFTYAQTFLITAAINYLETPAPLRKVNHAYGLIGATACIYIGIMISTATFYRLLFKLTTSFRGSTAALIYDQSLVKQSGYNELAAVTLMSTDIDRMAMSLTQSMDIWARVIEVGLGVFLLSRQIGAISVAPIIITILCFFGQSYTSKFMGSRQARWVKAVQRRVAISSSILRSMKSVKLSGLVDSMAQLVQSERVRELRMAKQFRGLSVVVNMTSNMPTVFSALVSFAAYSIRASINHTAPLTTSQAFTSFAILTLLTAPASQLLSAMPQLTAGMGCVRRVHAFISTEPFRDPREIINGIDHDGTFDEKTKSNFQDAEKSSQDSQGPVLAISSLVLKSTRSSEGTPPAAITLEAGRGTLTTILGPVGCGKSTLLRSILGEIDPVSGSIAVSTPFIAYCAQSPWLPNGRIQDLIIGPNPFDAEWYKKIITICELESDFSQMPEYDLTIVGSRGIVLSGGQKHRVCLARALYSRCSVLVLDDFLSSLDRKTRHAVAMQLFSKEGHVQRHGCTVLLATHTTTYIHYSDNLVVMGAGGAVKYVGPPENWDSSNHDASLDDIEASDENPPKTFTRGKIGKKLETGLKLPRADTTETVKRQTGDVGVWLYYGKSIGIWPLIFALVFVLVSVFTSNFPKLWLQWNTGTSTPKVPLFVGVYFFVSVVSILTMGGMIFQFLMIIGPTSGIRLHNILVKSAFAAPMSFFESTDSSIVLNRFSQDMSLIDMQLPFSAFGGVITVFMCLMNAILICLGSSYIAATIPVTVFTLYWIQKFYLRTSRQMRLLDLENRSPLYQQFTETLEGIETIRAYGWQDFYDHEILDRLNTSQRPYFLLYMIQRWLNLVLDSLVASLAIILVSLALCLPNSSSGGAIGVALSSILSFNTSLKGLIMTWTQLETSLGSVARTKSFEEHTPSEEQEENFDPGPTWPRGQVDISNVTVSYGDGTVALRDVSFQIKSGQKVGICGRTGSGKSTLISSLLRLVDPNNGKIVIDGVDIDTVRRNTVRERLICLPQDPLIFPGTFRFNLDPGSKVSDDTILSDVLKVVCLWDLVTKRGGLTSELKMESLSHGEQQLLALARAIVRKQIAGSHCILVLDEATSNLDRETETLIQEVIKKEFKDNTVITVAHRLETVTESDYIVMLEKGKVTKIGPPAEVL